MHANAELAAEFVLDHAGGLLVAFVLAAFCVAGILWVVIERARAPVWRAATRGWDAMRRAAWFQWGMGAWPWLRRTLDQPLSSPVYFGLHSALGFLVLVPALAVFVGLFDEVLEDEWLTRFDTALATAIARTASQQLLAVAAAVTQLGDATTLYAVSIATALVLLWRHKRLELVAWLIATGGNALLIRVLKDVVRRPRPEYLHGLVSESSYSFPSGHAQGSLVVYGMLAYLLARALAPAWRIPLAVLACLMVLTVGLSRIVLHVHYFSDVVAGFACGACWLALCLTGIEMATRHYSRSERIAA